MSLELRAVKKSPNHSVIALLIGIISNSQFFQTRTNASEWLLYWLVYVSRKKIVQTTPRLTQGHCSYRRIYACVIYLIKLDHKFLRGVVIQRCAKALSCKYTIWNKFFCITYESSLLIFMKELKRHNNCVNCHSPRD